MWLPDRGGLGLPSGGRCCFIDSKALVELMKRLVDLQQADCFPRELRYCQSCFVKAALSQTDGQERVPGRASVFFQALPRPFPSFLILCLVPFFSLQFSLVRKPDLPIFSSKEGLPFVGDSLLSEPRQMTPGPQARGSAERVRRRLFTLKHFLLLWTHSESSGTK